ncbi:MAG: putative Ig domain-containing protein [Spirochaetota bacterium]
MTLAARTIALLILLCTASCQSIKIEGESLLEAAVVRFLFAIELPNSISFSYPSTELEFVQGENSTSSPDYNDITSFSISPDLPDGLTIDSATGAISGTPTASQSRTEYTITGRNSNTSVNQTIYITISGSSSSTLSLSFASSYSYTTGDSVSITPTTSGTITSCTSSPSLPSGLSIDNSSCAISGTANSSQSATTYTVSASDGSSTATASFTITVNATTYTIGGSISGLGSSVVLQNNAGDDLTLTADGSFTFTTPITSGTTYSITVLTQPTSPTGTCSVTNASGTATANVTNVSISCNCGTQTYPWVTFTDSCNGTIKLDVTAGTWGLESYSATTLYYMKCSHGQTWDSSTNGCTGVVADVNFCDQDDNDCNGGTDTGTFGSFSNGGTSSAYDTCDALTLASNSDWRVPTRDELRLLVVCDTPTNIPENNTHCGTSTLSLGGSTTSPVISTLFPSTESADYWSATSISSTDAWGIHFGYGGVKNDSKTSGDHLRCIR